VGYEPGSKEARETAQRIVERIKADETFRDQLTKDPEGTLTAAGVPSENLGDFIHELGGGREVTGYGVEEDAWDVLGEKRCSATCLHTDVCGVSCFATTP
jgi:hypothetical protein